MKSIVMFLIGLLATALLVGCVESTTVVTVDPAGRGSITVCEFFSSDALAMVDGVKDAMPDMSALLEEGDTDAPEGLSALPVFLQAMIVGRQDEFGSGITLEHVEAAVNAQGWKGYEARFVFEDISTVMLNASSPMDGQESNGEPSYRFRFVPGEPAELQLIPQHGAAGDLPDTSDVLNELGIDTPPQLDEIDPDMGELMEGMGEAMSGLFGAMFKGMRMMLVLEVDGVLEATNAAHQDRGRPNRIVLVDVDFDVLMQHPNAMSSLIANQEEGILALHRAGVPGLVMEDPDKTVILRFR